MNELTISLDPRRKIPLYEQIYGFIREEIRGGRIHAGERLPSARALAGYLSVSRSTVDLAYEQLVSEGYLESEPCKGYFVCEIEGLYRLDEKKEETKEAAAREQPSFRYDFAVTGTAPGGFPQNIWKKISKEVLLDADDSLFQLGDAKGEHGLREAIRDYLHHARGVNCRTEQIIVGAGNDYLLIRLLKELGKEYTVSGENAGVHVLVHLPKELSEAEAVQRAGDAGVHVYGLEQYCVGSAVNPARGGTILLGYAGLSEEEIAAAAAILKQCWNA
ncbi:GntR family transcriptional regulator [Fusicatenibacter sp.]